MVFDLLLIAGADGVRFRTQCEDVGETPLSKPLPHSVLEQFAAEARQWDNEPVDRQAQARLGYHLFRALIKGCYRRHLDRARGVALGRDAPFVLRLRLPPDETLHAVPWELLHDGFGFLAKSPLCSVVRYAEGEHGVKTVRVRPPLRVLVTAGPPTGSEVIDLGPERRAIEHACRNHPDLVHPTILRQPVTWGELERHLGLRRDPFHVWHHCGHGGFPASDPERFHLLLANEAGGRQWVEAERISELAERCPELRMVILNACHGGSFLGLAPQLARINVPLVVGFPWAVGLPVAQELTAALHHGLPLLPAELALSSARHAVAARGTPTLEWSQALLFARCREIEPLIEQGPPADAKRPKGSRSGAKVKMRLEDVSAGRDAHIQGATSPNVGTVNFDVRGLHANRDVKVTGLAAARRYDRHLCRLLDGLAAGTEDEFDA